MLGEGRLGTVAGGGGRGRVRGSRTRVVCVQSSQGGSSGAIVGGVGRGVGRVDAKTDVWLGGRKSAVLGEELGSSFLVPLLCDVALLEAGVLARTHRHKTP